MKVETHINNSVSKKFRIKTLCLLMMCSYSALAIDTDGQNITADPQEIKQIQNQISVDTSNSGRRLGNGYDSVSLDLKSHTVVFVSPKADGTLPSPTAAPTLMGNSEAFFSVGVDLGFDSIRKALSGSGSASLNLPSISANGHIEIATKSAADSYVGTYTLFARLKPKKSVLLPDVVQVGSVPLNTLVGTGVGLQPTFSMSSRNETGEVLIATTGDEFVQAVEYGAWVMVTMKFEYLNAQDKIDIGGQIAVSFAGVVEVDADGNYVDIENAQSVNVSIIAKQVGGDPDQLPGVLSTSIISCTLDAPENCLDVFAAAATYVRQDFPAQFQADSLEGYNVTRYFTSRYDESGPVLASYMPDNYTNEQTFNSKIALRAMSSRWERALLDARRADYLLNNSVAYLSAGEVTQIASLKTLANANATALSAAITTCKGGAPDDCNTVWADQTWLQSYDQTVLDI